MRRRPVRVVAAGTFAIDLDRHERAIVREVCAGVRALIASEDEEAARLFPDAYPHDSAASAEYRSLVHDDLVHGRLAALDTIDRTLDAERIDHEQLGAWCGALNDIRLVLGERLGVTEDLYADGIDPRDPRAAELALYGWLTWLQGEIVEALAAELDASTTE
jgi:Domain of unknown function (DUF2017)